MNLTHNLISYQNDSNDIKNTPEQNQKDSLRFHGFLAQTFSLIGSIDALRADKIQRDLLSFIEQTSSNHIIIDFHQVEFLDSAGLMALVIAYKKAKILNKGFSIIGVSPSVKIIFEVSQLDKVLGISHDY